LAQRLKHSLGYLLATAGLVWVLHDVHPRDLAQGLVVRHPAWLLLAVTADILSYVAQGIRWRLFLTPSGRLTTAQATQAIYAGLFVNELVPMRFGEMVRAYLAARWLSIRFTLTLTSLAFERLTDGVWLAAAAGITALFVPLPAYMLQGAKLLATILFVLVALLFILVWFGRGARIGPIDRAARAIHSAATRPAFWLAFLCSSFILILRAMAFWFVMRAYTLPFSFWIGAAVFLIVHLGTAIPNAPANVGTFQFFVVAGLTFFGLDKATAAAFSIAVFLILTIPLCLIGFFALSRSGLTLNNIRLGIRGATTAAAEVR
jgi:glycosyltransferase 2 family protein